MGYSIVCNVCKEANIDSEYAGETGRNLYRRGLDYVSDVSKKRANKPLWKHVLEKHGGQMTVPMFQHFSMTLVNVFRKPQRRKANEGVRIHHLPSETIMNSKNEWMQGTNIYMQPVRGVGV